MAEKIRLDRYLSDMLNKTRKEVKEMIRKGRVTVNQEVSTLSDRKVEKGIEAVCVDGIEIGYTAFYYYMLHKPKGVITSTEKGRTKSVMDVLLEQEISCPFFDQLSPVGRLDKDTEGLLLFTNDGELIHRLLSPKKHIEKVYLAELDKPATEMDIDAFSEGLDLGDFISRPAKLVLLQDGKKALVTITEGKFHQVKRMFEKVGKEVLNLKRLSMGSLQLDDNLSPGEFRTLTAKEVTNLKKECGL